MTDNFNFINYEDKLFDLDDMKAVNFINSNPKYAAAGFMQNWFDNMENMARMLEKLAIEENTEAIMNIAPVFLGEWRSFKEKLSPLMPEESLEADELADFNRNLIEEQLELLIRAMEEFDVDRADELVLLLKKFKYPDNCKGIMEDIYTAVTNLDEDKVRECVEDFHHQ